MPVIIVWTSLVIPSLILTEASLSYLGVGVRVPNPSWGNMLQDAKPYLRLQWTLVFIPGFTISSRCFRSISSAMGSVTRLIPGSTARPKKHPLPSLRAPSRSYWRTCLD